MSFFKLTRLTLGTKTEQCSSYVPNAGGGHVEGFRGRGGGAGVDHAVRRDDRGLGPADPPIVRTSPDRPRSLGKRGTAAWKGAFRVDTSGAKHHH